MNKRLNEIMQELSAATEATPATETLQRLSKMSYESFMEYGDPDCGRLHCKYTSKDIEESVLQAHLYTTDDPWNFPVINFITKEGQRAYQAELEDLRMWYSALLKLAIDKCPVAFNEDQAEIFEVFCLAIEHVRDEMREQLRISKEIDEQF